MNNADRFCNLAVGRFLGVGLAALLACWLMTEAVWLAAMTAYRNPPDPSRSVVVFHAFSPPEDARRRAAAADLLEAGLARRAVFVGGARQWLEESGAEHEARAMIASGIPAENVAAGRWSYDTVSNVTEARQLAGTGWIAVSDCLHLPRIMWLARGAASTGYCPVPKGGPFWRAWRIAREAAAWASLVLPERWRVGAHRLLRGPVEPREPPGPGGLGVVEQLASRSLDGRDAGPYQRTRCLCGRTGGREARRHGGRHGGARLPDMQPVRNGHDDPVDPV